MTKNFRLTKTAAAAVARPTVRARRGAGPVEISRVDPRVLAEAKRLAGGDATRFKLVPARSRRYPAAIGIAVIVLNQRSS